ncbi:MAG: SPOR domain-containing protein [Antarcticimicrobium sp.]|uniref:SPOR domain-containing protein n=1 Tax=Antarcticimicrobium sp. TaxID=2824147 RepID=UPI0026102B2F|nr:SPOR domain-containing protein [Antarcticimicrobium sp.]MDF1717219.1 SPOR domain-containing protein [Antarcticimicrobium sp.]
MAEIEYTYGVYGDELYADDAGAQDGDAARARDQGAIGKAVNVAGALASLALVVGIGIWGYKLMIRDVSGVPVVRALEGPMREQPKDPGGQPADHQGLAVNAVAAGGTAAPPPDRLALAPRPVGLTDEDLPMGELGARETKTSVNAESISAYRDDQVAALVEELTRNVAPLREDTTAPAARTEPAAPEDRIVQPAPLEGGSLEATSEPPLSPTLDEADAAPRNVSPAVLNAPGVKRSRRPLARPARLTVASATGLDVAAALGAAQDAVARVDVDPDSVPEGARLAQLGAYDSPEVARAAWDRLNTRFGAYLDGKKRVIQKASSGGRTFYRLRAMGFEDLSDARRFCSALVAENADCIPVTAR